MKQLSTPPIYQIFLVTVWQERGSGAVRWRYTLENTQDGSRQSFVSWSELLNALHVRVDEVHSNSSNFVLGDR